jgi:hypothetical protein
LQGFGETKTNKKGQFSVSRYQYTASAVYHKISNFEIFALYKPENQLYEIPKNLKLDFTSKLFNF